MAYYSDELIEEVRSANDIVEVIGSYVHLQRKGSSYFGLCPFHNEKTPSFSVSGNKQMYYCFGCGAGGNVLTFLMKYENFTFKEAMESLADRAGITLPKEEMTPARKREEDRKTKLFEINFEAGKYYYALLRDPRGKHALDYFEKRELTAETMHHFALGCSGQRSNDLYKYLKSRGYSDDLLKDSGLILFDEKRGGYDRFWNRAMFPIMNANSRIIGFGGRVMGEGEPKYLNSPETAIFNKRKNLYGMNFARASRRRGLLLCEGYMDVIALHQAGFDNAVASLGTAFTSEHADLMRRHTKEVYLTFDSDEAGIRAALRAIPILNEAGLSAKVINMQPYKDPDEFIKALGADAWQERIDQAENSLVFEIRIMERSYNFRDPESRAEFIHALARRLNGQPDKVKRDFYAEFFAEKYMVPIEDLRETMRRERERGGIAGPSRRTGPSVGKTQEKEDGIKQARRVLLTWMADDASVFRQVSKYVTPGDFGEGIPGQTAAALFEQYETGKVNEARIVDMFEDEEQQREAAAMLNTHLQLADDRKEQEKALNEVFRRVKLNSIEAHKSAGVEGLQTAINERKVLDKVYIML